SLARIGFCELTFGTIRVLVHTDPSTRRPKSSSLPFGLDGIPPTPITFPAVIPTTATFPTSGLIVVVPQSPSYRVIWPPVPEKTPLESPTTDNAPNITGTSTPHRNSPVFRSSRKSVLFAWLCLTTKYTSPFGPNSGGNGPAGGPTGRSSTC